MDMNVAEHTSNDESTYGGGVNPSSTGFTPDALPEVRQPILAENSPTGVSTKNVLSGRLIKRARSASYWYVLRCAYGQEKKAYDYIVQNKGVAYYPTVRIQRYINNYETQ